MRGKHNFVCAYTLQQTAPGLFVRMLLGKHPVDYFDQKQTLAHPRASTILYIKISISKVGISGGARRSRVERTEPRTEITTPVLM